ncbi:hypothetical protein FA041_14345 [Escherichia coli]|nr:hypothetical protein [Escherichia coli]
MSRESYLTIQQGIRDPRELALLAQAMEHDTRGGIRMNSRYVSWERLDHFDGAGARPYAKRRRAW